MAPRSLPRTLLFGSLVVVGALAAVEGFCRIAERTTDVLLGPFEIDVVPDVLGFEPNHPIGHLDLETRANEGGYNGTFYPPSRRPGTYRVAVLGDSFTFGWGVPADEAWPALLQQRLDESLAGSGVQAEVLNFGVPGYNTWLELLHWRRVVSRYRPDAVLLGYYSNDAVLDRRVPNVYPICPLEPPVGPARWAALQERLAMARVAHDLYWVARTGSPLAPWSGPDVLVPGHFGFECSMAWAAELAADVEASGARFAVVQLPHMEDLNDPADAERAAQERLVAALTARGIATDDLYPALAGLDPAAVINEDRHPNKAGNVAVLQGLWPVTGQWLLAQALAASTGSSGTPRDPPSGPR